MGNVVAWVKSAPVVSGQDHLGTIAPAESIYGTQLPGITNLTARARYYSFYPWLLRELEVRRPTIGPDDFVDYLRRAECMFALVAIRHSRAIGEEELLHGAGMVGRDKLVPAIENLATDGSIAFSEHASRDGAQRYFMNPLGGLGLYYFGPSRELGILGGDTRARAIKYTEERGRPIAEAFGKTVDASRFFTVLAQDRVSLSDLDGLAAFCPCALANNATERRALIDLILDPTNKLGQESVARRSTLTLILNLAAENAAPEYDFAGEFRASAYSGALFDSRPWTIPEAHLRSRNAWGIYARHELLSIAYQGLFWSALAAAEAAGRRRFRDPLDLARFAVSQLAKVSPSTMKMTFAEVIKRSRPGIADWSDDDHEVQAGWRIIDRKSTPSSVATDALTILAAIVARSASPAEDPYAQLHFEADYFERYPINLRSFLRRAHEEWSSMTVNDALGSWIVWTLRTHWRVALQKLAGTPRDTFKVRPLDGEIQIVEAVSPTFSSPRIGRAVGILRDLGFFKEDATGRPLLTDEGAQIRGVLLG